MKKNNIALLSFFCGLLSVVFSLSSCEDLLTVDSARYVTVDDNELATPRDSVSSVLGLLRQLQNVGDRYVLLGEMRADLLDVTEFTPAAVRALSDFTVSDTSSYANPRDYYAIINNCNYFISRTSDENSPLETENALVHAIRAWTYMQVAFNWGKAYYITEPLLSVEDTQKEFPEYTIPQLIETLIADLEPFANADYPNYGTIYDFQSRSLFFPVKVLLGDLYLWKGGSTDDYEKAAAYYAEYIDSKTTMFNPQVSWDYNNFLLQNFETSRPSDSWSMITVASSTSESMGELVTGIQMATDASQGKTGQLWRDWQSFAISPVINTLWEDQSYVYRYETTTSSTDYYTTGDLRGKANIFATATLTIDKATVTLPVLYKIYNSDHIMLYRMGLVWLRYAEAVNRAGKPNTAFAALKYGLNPLTLADATKIPAEELADAKPYITVFNAQKYERTTGIHARGCGDSAYDKFFVIGNESEVLASKADSIQKVEDLICDELALETSFEGNRFQDLMRLAMRRNDPAFLAKRVAAKHTDEFDRIYNLLSSDTKNWFLPEPK
ncbi:MAG: RagB/SusD family nutrient uptake outer membrane protein [Tannerella sp.]|jgi:hypothetical protein|nr:RagB/SusD family nutrient uptake outer membrane protein [Tannerella sp.]